MFQHQCSPFHDALSRKDDAIALLTPMRRSYGEIGAAHDFVLRISEESRHLKHKDTEVYVRYIYNNF
ncbi:hypothetical protein [Gluconobacter oxydans]|uniref:hypothetical protein n=1 Tax=Gluconobacter oxydans TaxID=442 RepID=UPI001CD89FA9|nr:hypothetical protein [Gluconobacter oxydans]